MKGEGSIEQLGPRKWRVRAQGRDSRTGRKVSRSKIVHGPETAARRELADLRRRVRDGSKPKRLRLRAYATSWIASRAKMVRAGQMKPSVVKKYATSLDLHILESSLGDMYMDALTHDDVAGYVSDRLADGAAGNTVLNELRLLRTISRDSFAAGVAPRHWADRVKAPEGREYDEDDPNALTPKQLSRMLKYIPPQWLMMFGTLAFTGLRWGEVSALRWEDLDHETGEIRVRRSNWKGQEVAVKTKKSRRKIPIPPYLVPPTPDATGYIFPTRSGTLHKGTPLNKVIRQARERLNKAARFGTKKLPPLTPHGLRRTYNDLLRAVAPEIVIRALQGWASGAMPAHYSTVRADEKRLAAKKVLELVDRHDETSPSSAEEAPDGAQTERGGDE